MLWVSVPQNPHTENGRVGGLPPPARPGPPERVGERKEEEEDGGKEGRGEEAEAAGRPEMQEAAGGGGGEALCLSCSLGPSVHSVHQFLGSTDWNNIIIGWILTARFQAIAEG